MKVDRFLSQAVCHLEGLARLGEARIVLAQKGWKRTLTEAQTRAERSFARGDLSEKVEEWQGEEDRCVRDVECALHRMSRLLPGSTCIHRALAAQKMLIRRGFSTRVIIGLRKQSGAIEGHAWIEALWGERRFTAFWTKEAGYVAVLDPKETLASHKITIRA